MEVKVRILILSHLSDVQEMIGGGQDDTIRTRLNFVKYLTLTYPDNTIEVDPDAVFEEFRVKHPSL